MQFSGFKDHLTNQYERTRQRTSISDLDDSIQIVALVKQINNTTFKNIIKGVYEKVKSPTVDLKARRIRKKTSESISVGDISVSEMDHSAAEIFAQEKKL